MVQYMIIVHNNDYLIQRIGRQSKVRIQSDLVKKCCSLPFGTVCQPNRRASNDLHSRYGERRLYIILCLNRFSKVYNWCNTKWYKHGYRGFKHYRYNLPTLQRNLCDGVFIYIGGC